MTEQYQKESSMFDSKNKNTHTRKNGDGNGDDDQVSNRGTTDDASLLGQDDVVQSFAPPAPSKNYFTALVLYDSCPSILLEIVSFLRGQDLHAIESTSKEFQAYIEVNDKVIFSRCLRTDFLEGKLLTETVDTAMMLVASEVAGGESSTTTMNYGAIAPTTPYKKMYLAFRNRWKLHQQEKESIPIPWRRPSKPLPHTLSKKTLSDKIADKFCYYPYNSQDSESDLSLCSDTPVSSAGDDSSSKQFTMITDDVHALVFIFRIGSDGDAVALLEWKPCQECGYRKDKLTMNEKQQDCDDWNIRNKFDIPDLDNELIEMIDTLRGLDHTVSPSEWSNQFEKVESTLAKRFCISLHVVDIQRFQVMSIAEDCPAGEIINFSKRKFSFLNIKCPELLGVPARSSPYCKPLDEYNCNRYYDEEGVESLVLLSELNICQDLYPSLYFEGDIDFDFSIDNTVITAYEVCNYYRALMKKKCAYGGVPIVPNNIHSALLGPGDQKEWVRNERIVDSIASFLPFECQAGDLRLVSRQFKISAMRQIEEKLFDIKVIGFDRDQSGWKKVKVRRGWSDDSFCDSKDHVIDDAFFLASCRCHTKCRCKENQDQDKKAVTFDGQSATFHTDKKWVDALKEEGEYGSGVSSDDDDDDDDDDMEHSDGKEDDDDSGSEKSEEGEGGNMNALIKAAAIWLTEQDQTKDGSGSTGKGGGRGRSLPSKRAASKEKPPNGKTSYSSDDGSDEAGPISGKQRRNLDLDKARHLLKEQGFVRLHGDFPKNQGRLWKIKRDCDQHIAIDFSSGGDFTVFDICDKVNDIIEGNSNYNECEDCVSLTPFSINKTYGISSSDMTNKQFLRSLFLLFNCADDDKQSGEFKERASKRTRGGPKSVFAKAETIIDVSYERHVRMKYMIRFHTMSGEPIEILAEEKYCVS